MTKILIPKETIEELLSILLKEAELIAEANKRRLERNQLWKESND
jgi:hypothetical protein